MITNGFTYVAFLIFFAGSLVLLEKKTHWKIFEYIPPVVMLYLGSMLLCTAGLWDMKATQPAYGALKNNLNLMEWFPSPRLKIIVVSPS